MNRVTVTIAGRDYPLLTDDDVAFTQKVAGRVDAAASEILGGSELVLPNEAVLLAMTLAEELLKEQEAADSLRLRMKETLEEATRLKLELSKAKQDLFLAQGKK